MASWPPSRPSRQRYRPRSQSRIEWPRHTGEINRLDHSGRRLDLAAAVGAEEAPQLNFRLPRPPLRLPLERAEGLELALPFDDSFHRGDAESADQLVLQVRDAQVETETFHIGACEVEAEASSLEAAPEVALLSLVTEPSNFQVKAPRTEPIQIGPDIGRTPHRHDRNALRLKVPSPTARQGFERELIADAFNQDRGPYRNQHAAHYRFALRELDPSPRGRTLRDDPAFQLRSPVPIGLHSDPAGLQAVRPAAAPIGGQPAQLLQVGRGRGIRPHRRDRVWGCRRSYLGHQCANRNPPAGHARPSR